MKIITNYLEIFNRLSGSADEMGTFITQLDSVLKELKGNVEKANSEKEQILLELENTINKLQMESKEKGELLKKLKNLEVNLNNSEKISLSDSALQALLKSYKFTSFNDDKIFVKLIENNKKNKK